MNMSGSKIDGKPVVGLTTKPKSVDVPKAASLGGSVKAPKKTGNI
jgi:hypothetical protein